jgi:D-serine deaminase-like pyridoxal phosphate-dependent protein
MQLQDLSTPAALVDTQRMQRNIARMQQRMNALGVAFRPHAKTTKSVAITQMQIDAGARGITVSTLKEAEQFFAAGMSDIVYAVGMAPPKLKQAAALMAQGCQLKIVADSAACAAAIVAYGQLHRVMFEVWIEVDTDGHRAGVKPLGDELIDIGQMLHHSSHSNSQGGAKLGGVMTHAGGSYECDTPQALQAIAELERSLCVKAAQRLRAAGLPCPVVSVGSTPTALSAEHLDGVTEVRAGVYVFFDLVMVNVGVCSTDDVALSVLTTVIGHQVDKGWAIVDAGWMAMSRDRGTQKQRHDFGYGQVCSVDGQCLDGYVLSGANQEHGILSLSGHTPDPLIAQRFPVGTQLRILPNHACATGAQFPQYHALTNGDVGAAWGRFYGW